jgi:two-component sensor histidine kinase
MNRSGLEMINERSESDIIGRHYLQVVCGQDFDRVAGLLDRALAGEPSEFDFLSSVGKYFRSNFVPIVQPDGGVSRLLSITQDITGRRRLVEELNHRVKNNLAAVLALAEQTRHSAQSIDDFMQTLDGRIRALARSHDALAGTQWEGVMLHEVARLAVQAYMPIESRRVQVSGDDVRLPARACGPLTLALHEMTTNAVKHGAFSTASGRVELVTAVDDADELELTWREFDGRTIATPMVSGVGISLIRGFVEHELNGRLELDLAASGLSARMTIPLGALRSTADAPEPVATECGSEP